MLFRSLEFYSVDYTGNDETKKSVNFKIDTVAPTIVLVAEETDTKEHTLTAHVDDVTSGVAYVEFYVNDVLVGTVTDSPYEYVASDCSKGDTAYAIVYDSAGFSTQSATVVSQSSSSLVQTIRETISKLYGV